VGEQFEKFKDGPGVAGIPKPTFVAPTIQLLFCKVACAKDKLAKLNENKINSIRI
jgi:hypothetical protein